jgi:hypothetical protein
VKLHQIVFSLIRIFSSHYYSWVLFPGFPTQLKHFEQKVKDTLAQAHAVSTRKAQCNAVFTLALFCMFFYVNFPKVSIHTLLSFIVFLAENKLAVATIRNYVSSIKTRFV